MSHPLATFRTQAERLLEHALETIAPGTPARFIYSDPPEGMGELAAGCFPFAKALKKAPQAIATEVAAAVQQLLQSPPKGLETDWVAQAEAAGPYVNLHVDTPRLTKQILESTQQEPESLGRLPPRKESVILEHTSANPTGPLHVGRARNPIIGDTLVRLYRAAGYRTTAQYYMDDMGKQVAILTWATENLSEEEVTDTIGPAGREKVDHRLVRYYQAANRLMEDDPAVKTQIDALVKAIEEGDEATLKRVHAGYGGVFEGMLESLNRLNVQFDEVIHESRFVTNGDTSKVIEHLQDQDQVPVGSEGQALYLDLATKGVTGKSTRFYFRRSDGTSLYATRDVAYHLWKAQQADRLVNVLGEDHKLQAKQVRTCLELMDAKTLPEVVFYSFVSLPEGRMTTRKGRVVYLDDLFEEAVERAYQEVKKRRGDELDETHMRKIAETVGVGAVRFTIAKVQCEKAIRFKWEEALSFEGYAAPFIQYSHARVAGILKRAQEDGLQPDASKAHRLIHPSEQLLAKTIARLPLIVEEAADKHRPHLVPQYAYETAVALNAFYRDCRVLEAEDAELSQARLALVATAGTALQHSLGLIGIEAPDEM
jgi:arginyl-tRNA synthetase